MSRALLPLLASRAGRRCRTLAMRAAVAYPALHVAPQHSHASRHRSSRPERRRRLSRPVCRRSPVAPSWSSRQLDQ